MRHVCRYSQLAVLAFCVIFAIPGAGCAKKKSTTSESSSCAAIDGVAWTPNISGAGASNHDTGAEVSKTILSASGPVTGLGQAAPASREIDVEIDMTEDLGAFGSLTLVAKVTGMPAGLDGSAYPALVYLSDGTYDYINLARAGSGGDCAQNGYYTCNGVSCTSNSACLVNWPSAYFDRTHWQQHQIPSFGYGSVNTFPSCNWTEGAEAPSTDSACAFNTHFFPSEYSVPRLRYGGKYHAKYVLLAANYATVTTAAAAQLEVTVIKKKEAATATAIGGAVDLNIVIVGSDNIAASRTVKGKQNLDSLFTLVQQYFGHENVGVKLGSVNAIEWGCEAGGDSYANVGAMKLGDMFSGSKDLIPEASELKALNIFLVSTIDDDVSGEGSNLTILGLSGAIGGPMLRGTAASGLAFSSFDKLATYNPLCSGTGECSIQHQEADFVDMGATIAHEMGHFLGLNHPTEAQGSKHDVVYDTPVCTARSASSGYITISSCLNSDTHVYSPTGKTCKQVCTGYSSSSGVFCPEAMECQFNHIMWWTSKNFKEGTALGDGNVFSHDSSVIINYNPFIQ
ncbi:M43 family zinc metalloprotease [Bdellovibrionota bacterium FG-2]